MTRRTVLHLCTLAGAGGFAGCTSSVLDLSAPRITDLEVHNYGSEPHTVGVLIVLDGEPVYWADQHVPAAEDGTPAGTRFEGLPTGPDDYQLYIRIDDQPRSEWERIEVDEYATDCLGFLVSFHEDLTDGVGVFVTTTPEECDGTSTRT